MEASNLLSVTTQVNGNSVGMTVGNTGGQVRAITVADESSSSTSGDIDYDAINAVVEASTKQVVAGVKKQVTSLIPIVFGLIGFYVVVQKAEQWLRGLKKK